MRVWWRICEEVDFTIGSQLSGNCWLVKQAKCETHDGIWRVHDKQDFASDSRLGPSYEWPAKFTVWLLFEFDFSHSLLTLYKPSLPMKCKKKKEYLQETFERETLAKHLRVRDCLPTILYIIFLKFQFTSTSPTTHPWEVLNPNTYHTYFECWEKFWCLWKALEEAIEWQMQLGGIAGSE